MTRSRRVGRPLITAVSIHGVSAPSTRVRINDWFDFLTLSDVEHLYHAGLGFLGGSVAIRHMPSLVSSEATTWRDSGVERNIVLLSREAALLSRGSVETAFMRNAVHGVYDFDDALFHDDDGRLRRLYGRPEKARAAARAADVVVAGNDYLANWANDFARDVRIIPSCVDPRQYVAKTSYELDGAPIIVWLGSASTEQFVEHIASELAEIHRRTAATLRIISAPRDVEHPVLKPFVERIAWRPGVVAEALATADIAIAPLNDLPYSRGKCAYKLLQYAASGLPIVGSPVGANAMALDRFDGMAVHGEWVEALEAMIAEPVVRREQRGKAGVRAVQNHYSFQRWRNEWLDAVGLAGMA